MDVRSIDELQRLLEEQRYIADRGLATAIYLGLKLQRPLLLWRYRAGRFEEPRVALTHRGSFHVQILHVHPRFSPDGKQILFVSDTSGYGNLHLVDTPNFDTLPEIAL